MFSSKTLEKIFDRQTYIIDKLDALCIKLGCIDGPVQEALNRAKELQNNEELQDIQPLKPSKLTKSEILGKEVREAREKMGLNYAELGRKIGLKSGHMISLIEKGESNRVSSVTIYAIKTALGLVKEE